MDLWSLGNLYKDRLRLGLLYLPIRFRLQRLEGGHGDVLVASNACRVDVIISDASGVRVCGVGINVNVVISGTSFVAFDSCK